MKCSNCSYEISESSIFCPHCGCKVLGDEIRLSRALKDEFGTDQVNDFARGIMEEIVFDDSADAMERLAWLESRGSYYEDDDDMKDIPRSTLKAAKWLAIVADRTDSAEAHYWCANWYIFGSGANDTAIKTGLQHLNRAASMNWPRAHYKLGVILEEGLIVPKNDSESARHYKTAAALGDPDAMIAYSWCLAEGRGVPSDEYEALYWNWKFVRTSDARTDDGPFDYTPSPELRKLADKYELTRAFVATPSTTRTIIVRRKHRMMSGASIVYRLYVDNQYLTSIDNGQIARVEVSTDKHYVFFEPVFDEDFASIGPRRSPVFQVEEGTDPIEFYIDANGGGKFKRTK